MSRHKVISNTFYSDYHFEIILERNGIEYMPGSCASIGGKTYSFASSPNDTFIKFLIKKIGKISSYLSKLKAGEEIEIDQVFSYFKPGDGCEDSKYVYIATGSGIAPFVSAMGYYKHIPASIIYGAKTYRDLYKHKNLKNIVMCTSQDDVCRYNYVTDVLNNREHYINSDYTYYICGHDNMITDVCNMLNKNGVDYSKIETEQFFLSS